MPRGVDRLRTIVHVDMDAFFAAVEQRDHPQYRGKPVVVGADPQSGNGRGVVSTCSYEARSYGIHSAMPISQAYRRCPEAVFLRPRMDLYADISRKIMAILGGFSPIVRPLSIDEAFLDCTGTEQLFGSARELGGRIKKRILQETGLVASVGIASNMSLAKIASDLGKPDGLVICPPGREKEFLAPLPVSRLWGAGPKAVQRLKALGFTRVGDIAQKDKVWLEKHMGKWGEHLWCLANGLDDREVSTTGHKRKSISMERTFTTDCADKKQLELVLFHIVDRLTRRLRLKGLSGRTVTLKIRFSDFRTLTRRRTLSMHIDDTHTVHQTAADLFANVYKGQKVRLLGVGFTNLKPFQQGHQCTIQPAAAQNHTNQRIDSVLDALKKKYGDKVARASLLHLTALQDKKE